MRPLFLILPLFCVACTNVPELDDKLTPQLRNAQYPKLVPLHETLGPPVSPRDEAAELEEQLNARVASLQARAQRLQAAPVMDQAARDRLDDTILPE